MSDLTLYECESLIKEIEAKAEASDGELSEADWALLIQAQTTSMAKVEKLINYMKYLDGFQDMAESEIERINAKKQSAKNRLDSIKKYILPYVREKGKISVGTHTLSIRKSKAVIVAEDFVNPQYCRVVPERLEPDKKLIKESIESGIAVQGAAIEERESVQVK